MTRIQYWLGWIAFWSIAILVVRWFIVNPILNRLDKLIALGVMLEKYLSYRSHG